MVADAMDWIGSLIDGLEDRRITLLQRAAVAMFDVRGVSRSRNVW